MTARSGDSNVSRRHFLSAASVGLAGLPFAGGRESWPDEGAMARAERQTDSFDLLRAEQRARKAELPTPADFHRLPLSWYQDKARQLKAQARELGVDGGLLLTNRWNIIYATGLLHSTTERPFACFLPMDQDDGLIWLNPYLDEELVREWWSTDSYHYFDYHHAEGGFPNRGEVVQGPRVNLYRWWGEILAELGYGGRTIGIDSGGMAEVGILPGHVNDEQLDLMGSFERPRPYRPTGGSWGEVAAALPDSRFVDVYPLMIRSRVVKGEMENRLTQRAEDYWSEIHAFARNYMLERGTDAVDWEVANAAQLWGMQLIMDDIPQSGELHDAVGIEVGISCRSGRVTGYPHPNQTRWSPIEPGDALQIAGVVRIGGYGGEQYRSFMIAPWTDWQEHVWEVHTRSYEIQAEESYAGNSCSNVARAVHDYQVANDCAHLIYHRPGHGEGMEGHQPPYQALGDYSVMEAGMHFSNEPGLYDPENGFGFNHSNNILVAEGRGLQMGTVPVTKEWCFLDLS